MARILVAATLITATIPTPALAATTRVWGPEAAPTDPNNDPRVLYEAGERAYRLGRFQEALEKFEAAYEQSEQPLLLYNIALAYRQLYDVANDVKELTRGRAVLKNFMLVADRDPELDAGDARKLLAEVETLIAAHKANAPAPDPTDVAGEGTDPSAPKRPPPTGKDPGRTLKIAGAVTMGVGAAGTIVSAVLGGVFAGKGVGFSNELSNLRSRDARDCPDSDTSQMCRQLEADIQQARTNGKLANERTVLAFGAGMGVGIFVVGAGLVPFLIGTRRTKRWEAGDWEAHRVRVRPMTSRTASGLIVSGRF